MSVPSTVAELFSPAVAVVEVRSDVADESLLWPEEEAALGAVAAGRRRDFVLGRRCARLALARLGVEPAPILRGAKREPLWPDGVVGAITHTAGYAAAAVATGDRVVSLGLDAEPDEPLPRGVLDRIARPEDLAWVSGSGVPGVADPGRLLFTIKEAVYKTWFPLANRWLGFEDAHVTIDHAAASYRATITLDGPLAAVTGRYASIDGFVIASAEVPSGTFPDLGP